MTSPKRANLWSTVVNNDFLPRVGFIQGFLFTFALLLEGLAAFLLPPLATRLWLRSEPATLFIQVA